MQILSGEAARALEPALNSDAALLSPSTGIIDSHAYMLALRGDAEAAGAAFAFHTPLLHAKVKPGGIELEAGGEAPMTLECTLLVNAAGLEAPATARGVDGMPLELIPPAYLAKGNYFSCSARAPFSHLIYPVPEPGGLGVHLTLDMAGQARFGPDVEWVDRIDYAVDPARAARILSGDPQVLADAARRRPDAELFGRATEDCAAGGRLAGFPDPGPKGPWRRRSDQPVRDRIARADLVAGDRGLCRHTRRRMSRRGDLRRQVRSRLCGATRCVHTDTNCPVAALASRLASIDLDQNSFTRHEGVQTHPLGRGEVRLLGVR